MSETINIYECDREVVIILQGVNVICSSSLYRNIRIWRRCQNAYCIPLQSTPYVYIFIITFTDLFKWFCVCVCFLLFWERSFFVCFTHVVFVGWFFIHIKFELQKVIIHHESIIFEMFPLFLLSAINNVYTISHIRCAVESYNWFRLILLLL